ACPLDGERDFTTMPRPARASDETYQLETRMTASAPFNYRYFAEHAAKIGGRILDYGCGFGSIVMLGRQRGLDIWGADTFSGNYARRSAAVPPEVQDCVRKIENGRADFPDEHFDFVFSNQVLEHVADPEAVIADIVSADETGRSIHC